MRETITISIDGEKTVHIKSTLADYVTLCGLDGDDSSIGMHTIASSKSNHPKVNCIACREIWATAKAWKAGDFSKSQEAK